MICWRCGFEIFGSARREVGFTDEPWMHFEIKTCNELGEVKQ